MDDTQARRQAEARAALRRLVDALRSEMRSKGATECRYVAACPVARAGSCPGLC